MLTSNALPMLGRVLRIDERAEIARDIAAELAPDVIDDIEATYAADAAEWADLALDALLYEDERAEADLFDAYGLDDESTYADLVAAAGVTRMGDDRYALDESDLPGWGEARVAYEDFKSGFRITDRP